MHFLVSMLALFGALEGLVSFDDPDYQPSWRETAGEMLFECLMFPAISAVEVFRRLGISVNDFFEWMITIANSIAYAFVLDYIIFKWFRALRRFLL